MIIFDTIRDSLEYAKFSDSEVRKLLSRLVDFLEADLEEVDYQPSSLVEGAVVNLGKSIEELEHEENPKKIVETPDEKDDDKIVEDGDTQDVIHSDDETADEEEDGRVVEDDDDEKEKHTEDEDDD